MTQPFFVAGGALRADAPSYVERPADDKLYNLALAGHFAYVLTSRQMGKSSLMNRTARRLKETGVQAVRIDLTGIGVVTIDEWYFGLLTELTRQLRLDIDLYEWWTEREKLGHIQRFIAFLREVVLGQLQGQVIIFIDEIDTTLKLAYADDFFAGIRSIYNGRDAEPAWDRLSFILLGVATPSDLVQDNSRTPFNIGQGVELLDFSHEEGQLLQAGLTGLSADQQGAAFAHIYQWTDGHPYMTQHLCEQVAQGLSDDDAVDVKDQVDALVTRLFLSEKAQNEKNLSYVRDRIVNHPQRRELLRLYRSVLRGKTVQEDRQSVVQNELKLAALVKTKNGNLQVRNRIYAQNFDLDWVKKLMQINWTAVAAWSLGVIAFLAIALIGYDYWVDNTAKHYYWELSEKSLNTSEQRTRLATLFRRRTLISQTDYDRMAIDIFYRWSSQKQMALFDPKAGTMQSGEMLAIIDGLYTTFAKTENVPDNLGLLQQINRTLEHIESSPKPRLDKLLQRDKSVEIRQAEFQGWVDGREQTTQDEISLALNAYATAISINDENHAIRFERAKLWVMERNYNNALKDLDILASVVRSIPTATPSMLPISSQNNSSSGLQATPTPISESPLAETEISALTPDFTPSNADLPTEFTPTPSFYRSDFINSSDHIDAIQTFINHDRNLADALFVGSDLYENLNELGLVPSATPTFNLGAGSGHNVGVLPTVASMDAGSVTLSSPLEDILIDEQIFSWQPNGIILEPEQAYEVVFWEPGIGGTPLGMSYGVVGTTKGTSVFVDLQAAVDNIPQIRYGNYYAWGVLLVETNPYKRVRHLGGSHQFLLESIIKLTPIPTFTLIQIPTNTRTSSGGISVCDVLADRGIDCMNPRSPIDIVECRSNGCSIFSLPTSTLISLPTPIPSTPTFTRIPPTLILIPIPTPTLIPILPTPTLIPLIGKVTLNSPPPDMSSTTSLTFSWRPDFTLPPDHAFELVFWRDGQNPLTQSRGARDASTVQSVTVNLADLNRLRPDILGFGRNFWGVLVVETSPYKRIKLVSEERAFNFMR